MRAALWFLALFGIASAVALFAGDNPGTITVYWAPYRIDLSLNLVLLLIAGAFVLMHFALRGLSALFSLPSQARQWRVQQKERALHAALLDALAQLLAGRFSRARKSALAALAQEKTLAALDVMLPQAAQVRCCRTCWPPKARRPCRTVRRAMPICSRRSTKAPEAARPARKRAKACSSVRHTGHWKTRMLPPRWPVWKSYRRACSGVRSHCGFT